MSHIWMTYEWLIHYFIFIYEWLIQMRDMTHSCVWCKTRSRMHQSECDTSHTYGWVTAHIRMSHVTHDEVSYEQLYAPKVLHLWVSHVTHMNESCHTYEWAKSHIRMSHVTHMNESGHTYEWGPVWAAVCTKGSSIWIDNHRGGLFYVWRASFKCVTWLIHMWKTRAPVHERVLYLIGQSERQTSYVWGLFHICDMTHLYVRDEGSCTLKGL